ncbi:hypothetical protein AMJ83_08810 [candidate division WOR_3 bacterium SM23_42]|uniref:Biotin-protein ligase N-terminal domain-containing protein n=1 Tax=candidate division WOR_3 bacterium SM23_42 TaxID=1703779 RepID=A0A0S8FR10_UNCW3|nr:MAG: hypothetical protein AMJ83_08810 [candidate division WOR_3 bacterium SM23_42]
MKRTHWVSVILLLLCTCSKQIQAADIALYSDRGTGEVCVIATVRMFEWIGYKVALIDADFINNRDLNDFRIVCFPGGNMYQYAQDITSSGMEKVREFINNGGGYIGICGGAYFTGRRVKWQGRQLPMSPLAIFPGTTQGPVDDIAPYPDCVMCKIKITDHQHPVVQTEPDSAWIMYCYGPMLLPDSGADVQILGEYDSVGKPAVIAFAYGAGRVFIIGTHPEVEEDSDRDGIAFGDDFNDKGSDWELMRKATLWCLGELDD